MPKVARRDGRRFDCQNDNLYDCILQDVCLKPQPRVALRSSIPPMPMLPKLNRKRALFVLTKIDEILAWERQKEGKRQSATPISSIWAGICAKCGRDSTGG